MPPIRVTIVARIPLIREGLRALLANERDFQGPAFQVNVLAPVDDWLDDFLATETDVLLLDVQVLEREGWELLDELQRTLPAVTTLVLSDSAEDRRVPHALKLGARGYLLREASAEEMTHAIRAAHHGSIVLDPDIANALVERLERADEANRAQGEEDERLIEPLSERELDVLRLMTRGLPNKQIAAHLFITEHTVKFHIRSILGKLGAANRTEAVTLALQKGLVSL